MAQLGNPSRDPRWHNRRMAAGVGMATSALGVLTLLTRPAWDAFFLIAGVAFWLGLLAGGAFFYIDVAAARAGKGQRAAKLAPGLLEPAFSLAYLSAACAVIGLAGATAQLLAPILNGWLVFGSLGLLCWLLILYVNRLVDSAKAAPKRRVPARKANTVALKAPRRKTQRARRPARA